MVRYVGRENRGDVLGLRAHLQLLSVKLACEIMKHEIIRQLSRLLLLCAGGLAFIDLTARGVRAASKYDSNNILSLGGTVRYEF